MLFVMQDDSITMPRATNEVVLEMLEGFIRLHGQIPCDPLVIEAKRLRLVVSNWYAIPPMRDVRVAMIARISEILESVEGLA